MVSSLPSFDSLGSPEKPGSSIIHLCRSVIRMVRGSTPGCFSASWMPISSALSQSNVCGTVSPKNWNADFVLTLQRYCADLKVAATEAKALVLGFFGVVFIPLGDFDHNIFGAVGDTLAAETRFRRDAGGFVQLIELGVGSFVAGVQAFVNDHVAGGAGAHTAAGVVQTLVITLRNIEDAAGQAVVAIGNFFGIYFDRLAVLDEGDFIFLRRGREFCFFDVGILAAHS